MKRSRSSHHDQHPPHLLSPLECSESAPKVASLDHGALFDNLVPSSSATMFPITCNLPPHKEPLAFPSCPDYEAHYTKEHLYRCAKCHKNLPSAHYLALHFEECHDPFAAVKRDKGEHTYSCFVEDCDRMCRTPQKRRMHAIDKHMFPKNYFFAVTKEGIDGRTSLLLGHGHHRRRSSTAASTTSNTASKKLTHPASCSAKGHEERPDKHSRSPSNQSDRNSEKGGMTAEEEPDVAMEDLAGAMSSLRFVPHSIRFGRSGKKAGFAKK